MINNLYIRNIKNLILKIVSILILYQFCRICFFLYNKNYFSDISLNHYLKIIQASIRFDLSAILYINSIIILLILIPSNIILKKWYKLTIYYSFIYLNLIGVITNIIDIFYYPFSKRRLTTSFLAEFKGHSESLDGKGVIKMCVELFQDYWFVIPILILIFYTLKSVARITETQSKQVLITNRNILNSLIISLLSLTLVVFGFRGSFIIKNRPITISNAGKYTNNPNEISLIINTPFSLIRTYTIKDLNRKDYLKDTDLKKYIPIKKHYSEKSGLNKKNVIIIILESMSTEYYGFYNRDLKKYQGYTPFLDSLIAHSYTSYNSFANGTKSIDAIPSILASIPATRLHFSLSKYCTNKINGIGSLLKEEGYQTSFFHGAPNGSMGFESMNKLLGVTNYFGMDNYQNRQDFDGVWGIWDHKFFPYFADKIDQLKEPFFSSIFSCSSHHPYKIPKEFSNTFKEGKHDMHKCVQYTDHSLKLFFNKIKNKSWFRNTLFVITADHTNISFYKKYRSSEGIFRVPIIFFDPSNIHLNTKTNKIIQQIDIMPSILSYLNYNKPFISLGNDIFSNKKGLAINYNNGFQLIIEDKLIVYNEVEEKITKIFKLEDEGNKRKNIMNNMKYSKIKEYQNLIQAFIQTYNNRMINNNLTLEN